MKRNAKGRILSWKRTEWIDMKIGVVDVGGAYRGIYTVPGSKTL